MKNRITRRDFLTKTLKAVAATSLANALVSCEWNDSRYYVVYISRCSTYSEEDYGSIKQTVAGMVEALYNKKRFFSYGDKLSIKVNLVSSLECLDMSPDNTYVTSPVIVKALGETLKDMGAGSLSIIEGSTHPSDTQEVFAKLGYDEVASYLGIDLIDLNKPAPYSGFYEVPVENALIYSSIKVNQVLVETDCLISAGKLKCHQMAGVSLSLKNLIGLLPAQVYGIDGVGPRFEYVHSPDVKTQIPYNIVDLARTFPVDFAFIDGVTAMDKGEGPWVEGVSYVTPGVLIAGHNPVATDSAAASVMGFDAAGDYPDSPFTQCENHIQLAANYGVGSNKSEDIEILGESISDVLYPYAF